jgi:hypothetical protein
VAGFVSTTGAAGIILTIIVSALLVGVFTYVAINKGLPDLSGLEKYYTKSKYWTAYAIQKAKWKAKRKKMKAEIGVEMPKLQPSAAAEPEVKKEAEEEMLFGKVMETVDKLGIKLEKIEEEVKEIKDTEKPAKPAVKAEKKAAITKAEQETKRAEPEAKVKEPSIAEKKAEPKPAQPAAQTRQAEPERTTSEQIESIRKRVKQVKEEIRAKEQEEKDALTARFGTNDALKVADEILKSKKQKKS